MTAMMLRLMMLRASGMIYIGVHEGVLMNHCLNHTVALVLNITNLSRAVIRGGGTDARRFCGLGPIMLSFFLLPPYQTSAFRTKKPSPLPKTKKHFSPSLYSFRDRMNRPQPTLQKTTHKNHAPLQKNLSKETPTNRFLRRRHDETQK